MERSRWAGRNALGRFGVNTTLIRALSVEWRADATVLRRRSATVQAEILESVAEDLDQRLEEWATQDLSVADAATESGYTQDHLRELVRRGRLPDRRPHGSEGRIVIRRCDLPRKPPECASVDDIVDEMLGLMQ